MQKQIVSRDRASIFVPFSKFDEERGVVGGYAAEEAEDRSREIMDYAGAKPEFESWSNTQKSASGGKSLGNVRAMHSSVAAGVVELIDYQDAQKRVYVEAKIVDADSLAKVKAGVYTGFSIGGSYAKKWVDGDLTRYVPKVQEISLVDRPCMPGAVFTVTKADGSTEERPLVGRRPSQFWDCGKVEHRHATKVEAVKCDGSRPEMAKSMYDVADLAGAISYLNSIRINAGYEASWEGDESAVPDALAVEIRHLNEILLQMTEEESAELLNDLAAAAPAVRLRKAAESMNKAADELDAATEEEMKPEELQKIVGDAVSKSVEESFKKLADERLGKIEQRLDATEKATADAIKKVADELELVKAATPERSKLAVRAVGKVDDGKTGTEEETPAAKSDNPVDLMKHSFRTGVRTDPFGARA